MRAKSGSGEIVLGDEQFHAIGRALADPRRFAIFEQVAKADGMACGDLREHKKISPATISHHLKELSDAGLIRVEREGRIANLTVNRAIFAAYLKRLSAL
jgi:ArsR family transcriptional regulator, arsenate/arsenite/antimonite-responsive transcriptional repressor